MNITYDITVANLCKYLEAQIEYLIEEVAEKERDTLELLKTAASVKEAKAIIGSYKNNDSLIDQYENALQFLANCDQSVKLNLSKNEYEHFFRGKQLKEWC